MWWNKTLKFSLVFAWYDLWVGAYWDKQKRRLYILPLPTLGVCIDFSELKN